MECYNNYAVVDLNILKENFRNICAYTKTPVMAVIKADAYGHGAVEFAKALEQEAAFFGVAALSEALELRENGIDTPILMLGHTPVAAYPETVKHNIRSAIFCYEDALALSTEAQKQGKTVPFHFAVDTGMSRIGVQVCQEAADLCQKIAELPNIYAEGMFTHFSNADDADQTRTENQLQKFKDFQQMLRDRGLEIPICHAENSAALTNFTTHGNMVRAGIILYGLYPSREIQMDHVPFKPVLSWYSHVTHVKTLEEGRTIGYGGTYTVTKPTTVATVSVGYADGYRRLLSGRGWVLIGGKKAHILGRVCMDQIMVDVTDIPHVKPGDKVTLLGTDGGEIITADHMAAWAETISYEILCGLSRRVPRIYK